MSEEVCVCGHPKAEHVEGAIYQVVCRACATERQAGEKKKSCNHFRPVLPWPDDCGFYWCDCGNPERMSIVKAVKVDGRISILTFTQPEFVDHFGYAFFVRLIEPNPFQEPPCEPS